MSTVTDSDLKEIKDLIKAQTEQLISIDKRLTVLETGQNEIKERVAVIETRIEEWRPVIAKITELAGLKERVDDLNSRFNIMTIGFLSIIGVLVTGILGAIAKLVFFPNP